MKIAMISTPILGRGGGERQIVSLASELQKRGHYVEIFVSAVNIENSYSDLLKRLNVTIIPHPFGEKMPKWLSPSEISQGGGIETAERQNRSSLQQWMRKSMGKQFYTIPYELPAMINIGKKIPKGFDIINNHNYPSEWAAFAAKKKINAPIAWMCNEPPFYFFVPELRRGLRKINWPIYNIFDRIAVDYIDEIIVLSHIAGGYVRKAYKRSSRVIRSGIDTEKLRKANGERVRKKYGLTKDYVLLQVGNIEINKRQVDSVKALQILSDRYKNIKLVFDGGGRREELIRLTEKLGVKDKVIFLRSSNDTELAEVYASCDVFLFPAQITWGLAVIEAMAAAKPVIVSNKCGASEIIQNNVNGIIINHAKPDELAKKAEMLFINPDIRNEIGKNASEYVNRNLSWEKFAERMENVFEKTILTFKKRT